MYDTSYPLGPSKQAQQAKLVPGCNSTEGEGVVRTDSLCQLLLTPKQGGERAGRDWMLTSCFRDAI